MASRIVTAISASSTGPKFSGAITRINMMVLINVSNLPPPNETAFQSDTLRCFGA